MKRLMKSFKFQKIMFVINILAIVINVIFALSFMTQYTSLAGLEHPLNESIISFYNAMQSFNKTIFLLSAIGLIEIIVMFALETNKKVADKFALIVLGVFCLIIIGSSIYEIISTSGLMNQAKGVDFKYASLEDKSLENYKIKSETFYLCYAVNILSLLSSLGYFISLLLSHIFYLKKGGEKENAE